MNADLPGVVYVEIIPGVLACERCHTLYLALDGYSHQGFAWLSRHPPERSVLSFWARLRTALPYKIRSVAVDHSRAAMSERLLGALAMSHVHVHQPPLGVPGSIVLNDKTYPALQYFGQLVVRFVADLSADDEAFCNRALAECVDMYNDSVDPTLGREPHSDARCILSAAEVRIMARKKNSKKLRIKIKPQSQESLISYLVRLAASDIPNKERK